MRDQYSPLNSLGYWKDQDPERRKQLDVMDAADQARKDALIAKEQERTRAPLHETFHHSES